MSTFDSTAFPIVVGLGALSAGEKVNIEMPFNFEVLAVSAPSASVAPVGAAALIDVEIGGTSVFSTRLTFADGATAPSGGVLDTTETITAGIASNPCQGDAGDNLTLDVDQVGSGTAGTVANATIWIKKR